MSEHSLVLGSGPIWVRTIHTVGVLFIAIQAIILINAAVPGGNTPALGFGNILHAAFGFSLVFLAHHLPAESDDD